MKRQHRLIPTRDSLLNTPSKQGTPTEATALDLLLHLTFAADAAREQIYRPSQDAAGLTEGKLLLLTTLKNAGGSMSVGMLARRLGVTDATTSIMVSRMLKDAHPLVERSVSELDRRGGYYHSKTWRRNFGFGSTGSPVSNLFLRPTADAVRAIASGGTAPKTSLSRHMTKRRSTLSKI